jgi:hypothetical protein
MLSCLGSTNATPVAFSEFRYDSVEKFLRYILLSYDTGHDPRGRADQTTVDYALTAPFSVDGEDLIADPAARERIVVAALNPMAVAEGTDAYASWNAFRDQVPSFGGSFIRDVLRLLREDALRGKLAAARKDLFELIPTRLPDRVRNNHTLVLFGARLVAEALGCTAPDPGFLLRSIGKVFNMHSGRSRTLCDDMVEDLINATPCPYFKWSYDRESKIFWFQMASAHSWWLAGRRRTGRSALERDAIATQLKESPYSEPGRVVEGVWMLGVNLVKAVEAGLDVPQYLQMMELTLRA